MALKLCLCAGACLVVAQTTAQSNDLQVKKGLKINTFFVVLSLRGMGVKTEQQSTNQTSQIFQRFLNLTLR